MTKNENEEIRIHGLGYFDRGAKARWLLTEMNIDFTAKWMDFSKKENEKPEYLKLNPMGRVPHCEIKEVSIFESGAICAYLADLYSEKGFAPSLNSPDRAKYLQWMFFASATLDTIQGKIMIIEDIPAGEVRKTKEENLLDELTRVTETLDLALRQKSYLVGDRISAADICVGYHLYFLTLWPELAEIIFKSQNVVSYLNRLKERPAAIKTKALSYEG